MYLILSQRLPMRSERNEPLGAISSYWRGVSAIIDRQDIVPSAVEAAGGNIVHFGVPVDPGSLLMLGYLDNVPVLGAPGCIKSLKNNVIDWILPRLLAGEHLTRAHLVAMGHGGLLDDISERPMPRSQVEE